jgi:hypothetical protein
MASTEQRPSFTLSTVFLAPVLAIVLALAITMATGFAGAAHAAGVKSKKTEARFVSYDETTKTLVVKVLTPGKKPDNGKLSMKRGKQAKFRIRTGGSILVRTSVTADGQKSSVSEIPTGKIMNIYWVPDEDDENVRFARKIEVVPAPDAEKVEAE